MANYVDNAIRVNTNHPVLIDLLKSLEGFNGELFEAISPIGEWSSEKASMAWGCSGMIDGYVEEVTYPDEEDKDLVEFIIRGQTKWVYPVKFLEGLQERFEGGGFTTDVKAEWIEETGYLGTWVYGDEFYEKLEEEDYKKPTGKFNRLCQRFSLIDIEWWFSENM
jgi:hypothetical protein